MDPQEQMNLFYEIFDASLPRLGPGDEASTLRALKALLPSTSPRPTLKVLDIGCGNGPQTIQLAKLLEVPILAIDNHQSFLDELNRRAKEAGAGKYITTKLMDMRELKPEHGPYDLIWTEGALSLMGLNEGLAACHGLLEKCGMLALTELCWFKPGVPAECADFFGAAYPAMALVEDNLSAMKSLGFEIIGHFNLPESSWLDNYLLPLEARIRFIRERHSSDPERLGFIEHIHKQVDIYRKHSEFYGYTFFMLRAVKE